MVAKSALPKTIQKHLTPFQKSFLLKELIGKKLVVKWSSSKELQGLKGTVIDETQNTFLLETRQGVKRVPKKNSAFYFPEALLSVEGELICLKPEERTKKLFKLFQRG